MNVVVLVGRLTRDPELRTTQTGYTYCNFNIAVDRRVKAENQPTADFINCIAWGRTAELINQYLNKGRQIAVSGHIQTRSWQAQDGTMRYGTDVVVDNFDFIGSRNDNNNYSNNFNQQPSYNQGYNQAPPNQNNMQNQAPLEIDDDFSLLADDDDVPF